MSEDPKGLQMMLPAKAENVAVVRHALAGLAEEMGMDEAGLADLKTVVTEACMNVVVHAYGGEAGPLSVEAEPRTDGLFVVVRDSGEGIRPEVDAEQPSLRLGLSLIAALSNSFAISGELGGGTEIRMLMPLHGEEVGGERARTNGSAAEHPAQEATEIVVGQPELLGPVLARLVGALAARRDLSIDRISDAVLVTDAIAAGAPPAFADGHVRIALEDRENGLELRLGPMEDGGAERLRQRLDVPEIDGSLEALADELAVDQGSDGDYLMIRFAAAERQG